MLDSDQSFLLNSYNQNQQHFANTTHSLHHQHKINKNNHEQKEQHIQNQKYCQKSIDGLGIEKIGVGDTGILYSIMEDRKGQEKSDSRIKFNSLKVALVSDENQQSKKLWKNHQSKFGHRSGLSVFQKYINPFNSELDKPQKQKQHSARQSSKPSQYLPKDLNTPFTTHTTHQQQQPQSSQTSSQSQSLQHLITLTSKFSQSTTTKFHTLSTFLLQFYHSYSELTSKIQHYEHLVNQLQNIIIQQQQSINTYHREYQLLCKKIEKIAENQQSLQQHFANKQFKFQIEKLYLSLVQIINQSISQQINKFHQYNPHYIDTDNQYTQDQISILENINPNNNKNKIITNYVQPTMNITKSVPLLATLSRMPDNTAVSSSCIKKAKQLGYMGGNKQNQKPQLRQSQLKQTHITLLYDKNQPKIPPSPSPSPQLSQQGQTFRKLANLRIKQLQKSNTNLINQMNSTNVKFLVLNNQNKQLREIIQGLIVQISHMNNNTNGNCWRMKRNYTTSSFGINSGKRG